MATIIIRFLSLGGNFLPTSCHCKISRHAACGLKFFRCVDFDKTFNGKNVMISFEARIGMYNNYYFSRVQVESDLLDTVANRRLSV